MRARIDGVHYRLFCVLDVLAENVDRPLLTVIDADSKPNGEVFAESRYVELSELRDEYFRPDENGRPVRSLAPASLVASYIART